jgi:hypothetical protein
VTIAVPTSGGWTFKATLEEDEHHMLWLNHPNRSSGKRQGRYLLTAVLKIGWRIVDRHTSGRCLRRTGSRAGGCSDGVRLHSFKQAATGERPTQLSSGAGGEGVDAPPEDFANVTDAKVRHLQDRDQCHGNQREHRWRVVNNKADECFQRWLHVCAERRAVRSRTPYANQGVSNDESGCSSRQFRVATSMCERVTSGQRRINFWLGGRN